MRFGELAARAGRNGYHLRHRDALTDTENSIIIGLYDFERRRRYAAQRREEF